MNSNPCRLVCGPNEVQACSPRHLKLTRGDLRPYYCLFVFSRIDYVGLGSIHGVDEKGIGASGDFWGVYGSCVCALQLYLFQAKTSDTRVSVCICFAALSACTACVLHLIARFTRASPVVAVKITAKVNGLSLPSCNFCGMCFRRRGWDGVSRQSLIPRPLSSSHPPRL